MTSVVLCFCFLILCDPPISILFPYATLFRSRRVRHRRRPRGRVRGDLLARGHRGDARLVGRQDRELLVLPRPLGPPAERSEEHTSELQSHSELVCGLLLEKKTVAELTAHTEF